MSIKIHHGYRIHTDAPLPFLSHAGEVMEQVRNDLDAALFANILTDLIDRHDRAEYTFVESVKLDALWEFEKVVNEGKPGEVWNHPHSLDLDFAYDPRDMDPDLDPEHIQLNPAPLYVLLHCQRDAYTQAFEALPEVEPFPYWNSTDRPDDLTDEQWAARAEAWRWLLDAPSSRDAMTRWTFRENPSPNGAYVLDDSVILNALPTRTTRASKIAEQQAVVEHFAGATDIVSRMGEVFKVLRSPRVTELITEIEPTLRTITAADLTRGVA